MSGDKARADVSAPSTVGPDAHEGAPEDGGQEDRSLRSTDPAECRDHGLVHPEGRPWLPKQDDEDLAPHPYCTSCGEVMGIGRAGGLDRGDLVNLFSELESRLERAGHTVTDVQKRLIFKRIDEEDLDDPFGFTRDTQLEQVTEIASGFLGIPQDVLLSYVRST